MVKKKKSKRKDYKEERQQLSKRTSDRSSISELQEIQPIPNHYIGLKNQGNTCYLNSVVILDNQKLQCLIHCVPLRKKLADLEESERREQSKGEMGDVLMKTLFEYERKRKGHMSPKLLLNAAAQRNYAFRGTSQHDAHEFLCVVLSALSDDREKDRDAYCAELATKSNFDNLSSGNLDCTRLSDLDGLHRNKSICKGTGTR
ncbi:hypothetical protein MHBO_000682 [Bonamia ostreae]|uniref:USP domain-containing protein n=1 Tax=Bonamia ostreae TaxID=126728 RepID=A0ABV2AHN7_9EUKA